MSESLCALITGLVTVRAVEHFYLAVGGNGKSFGRSLMCFDLSHFKNSFFISGIWILPVYFGSLRKVSVSRAELFGFDR